MDDLREDGAGTEMIPELIAELIAELGDAVRVDGSTLDATRVDKSGHVSATRPLAVIDATTIEQVQATMRFATRHRIAVVPRGAGTGLAGGAIGGAGELVLSTRRLDAIHEISAADEIAIVGPGVINAELNAVLAERGLWWAPDPASKAISTVGGNIATNAGGLLCVKYGVTREAVLGLTVVLADGRLLELGHRTVKGVTGYDLTALMIGSEGTLGVIVRATLRLRPLPVGDVATVSAFFDSVELAASASAAIMAAGLHPAALELLDARSLASIGAYLGRQLGTADGRGSQLLVQLDGASAAAEAAGVLAIIQTHGGRAELTTDPVHGDELFAIRRAFHPAMEARGTVLIEDVAVPRSALAAMFAAIERIEREYGLEIPTVAHAGDGNLHPNFIFEGDTVPERVWAAADELFRESLRLGGTLTGEHGIGILKKRWLRDELGDDSFALQRELKRVFDPLGILNPGKVF